MIGVTRYCIYPTIAQQKIIVGGTKSPNINKIKELKPDIILVNYEENTQNKVEQLMKIAPVFVTYPKTIPEAINQISQLHELLQSDETIAQSIIHQIQEAQRKLKQESILRVKAKVFCPIWKDRWMSTNADTFIHSMLSEMNFINITANFSDRYPKVEILELPEVNLCLLPDEPYRFSIHDIKELKKIKSFQHSAFEFIDGSYLSWHGSRLVHSLTYFLEIMKKYTKILV